MSKIDAHLHIICEHPDGLALFRELGMRLINVCVVSKPEPLWRTEARRFRRLAQAFPDVYAWCTSFDLPDWTADWADRVIAQLNQDFAQGAVGCKIWKNVGMEIKKPDGSFLLPDDPLFDPLYEYLAWVGKPLLAHIAEPLACWQPLEPGRPHYGYYSHHPEWHMYHHPDHPSHTDLIAARDRVLQKHPRLRMIGAHLASLEYDVTEIARRLDLYPNLAVDTSARLDDLAVQDSDAVRQFFIQYQERILFGTDLVEVKQSPWLVESARQHKLSGIRGAYETWFAYLESPGTVQVGERQTQGLGLPADVLDRVYRQNAIEWFVGL